MKNRLVVLFAAMFVCACNDVDSPPPKKDRIVVNKAMQLSDGRGVSWDISPGRYKLEVAANNNGAGVEWVGANCPSASEVAQYSIICDMPINGQIIIKNPSLLGLGPDVNVSVKITLLAN